MPNPVHSLYIYVCIYMYMYVYIYMCVYVYIYIYIYIKECMLRQQVIIQASFVKDDGTQFVYYF